MMPTFFKKLIKRVIPINWLTFYTYKRNSFKFKKNRNDSISERFTEYYQSNYWGGEESVSGRGSDPIQTETLIGEIRKLIQLYSIKTILDIPCGDFHWMKNIDFSDMSYIGGDIVEDLILKNTELYADRRNIKFEALDITKDNLPQVDLIICRDCLVHLSYKDISKALSKVKQSNSKYLLATSFVERKRNYNITTGQWRPINLDIKPFNLSKPILIIDEKCTEDNGKYSDKSMCLYQISNII